MSAATSLESVSSILLYNPLQHGCLEAAMLPWDKARRHSHGRIDTQDIQVLWINDYFQLGIRPK